MPKDIPKVLKGFRDYPPQEAAARKKIIAKISEVFERFGFVPIDTPSLESYQLFKGKIGEEEKLMYKFEDLGGREVALRYDLTVPLCRFVSQYPDLPKPFKRYQIANVWRAENPQKGRFREFMQCDVDIIGVDSLIADAEVVATLSAAFKALEVSAITVKFNNRQLIDKVLKEKEFADKEVAAFLRLIDKLDKIGKAEVARKLEQEGFDLKLEKYRDEMKSVGKKFVTEFENYLGSFGVEDFEFDPFLARGLDYYTGTIFEFVLKSKPEFGSIAGGGRYDDLIGKISGKDLPAVGGSIGLDRLVAAMSEEGIISPQTAAEVIIFNLDKNLTADYLNLATNLRDAGIDAEFYFEPAKLDKQFKYALAKNMQIAVIFGEEEAKKRKVNLKNLKEKEQITVDLDDLITEVKSMLW